MYFKLVIQVLGGLALFIFGMTTLSDSLQKVSSNSLKSIINILQKKPWASVLVGLGTTMVIQSSSATSVMTIGFVNAGLMTLKTAIGIIMGANIGTTITAQIVSFNIIDVLSYPLIIVGFLLFFISKRRRYKNIGMAIIGLGLLFHIFGTVLFFTLLYGFKLGPLLLPRIGSTVPHQIANMHTIFNITTTIILFPIIGLFEKLVVKLYPGKDIIVHKNALYLDSMLIGTPSLSLEQAKKEL